MRTPSEWIAAGAEVYAETLYDGTPGLDPSPVAESIVTILEEHGAEDVLKALVTATAEAANHLKDCQENGDTAGIDPEVPAKLERVRAALQAAVDALA